MAMPCPVCRADNTERTCRRCRADLGLLWDLEGRRGELLRRARAAWERGDAGSMVAKSVAAAMLRPGVDAARMSALGHLAAGDFAAALAAWREAQGSASRQ